MKREQKIRFGLTPKLFLLVLISFGLLISVIVWRVGVEANALADATIKQSLEQSAVILNSSLQTRYEQISETAKSLARDGRVLPRVFESDSATLQDLTSEFKKALDFDILIFTNAEGDIIARSDKPRAIGRNVAKRHLYQTALQGEPVQGIMNIKQKLLQVVAIPIFDNVAKDIVRGVVAIAYELSEDLALQINQLTHSDIGFFVYPRSRNSISPPKTLFMTNTSLGNALENYFSPIWEDIFNDTRQKIESVITLKTGTFHTVIIPLLSSGGANLGFISAVRSRTELLQPFTRIKETTLMIGLLCLLIASLVAFFLAKHIAKPIIDLASVTKDIQAGKYPSKVGMHKKNDEVGFLTHAIYRMAKELKEKAEVESYLAGLADSLAVPELIDNTDENENENNFPSAPSEDDITGLEKTMLMTPDIEKTMVTEQANEIAEEAPITAKNLAINSVFANRYRIIKALGSGAMGMVYMANDEDLNETVALKIIYSSDLHGDELEQFKQEIRLARKITNRNILRTFDFGVADELHFITMEFIQGFDLNELINKKGHLELHIGILLAKQICSALAAAHDEGIIHRDLKPQNMMINRQGILKIMDFGLAMRVAAPYTANGKSTPEVDISQQSGGLAGTPNYMSPEQFRMEDLDARSDIYAIGIILYKMFTGRTPFMGKTVEAMAMMHLNDKAPKMSEHLCDIPESIENIVQKAMEKDKNKRFQSIAELQDALQNLDV